MANNDLKENDENLKTVNETESTDDKDLIKKLTDAQPTQKDDQLTQEQSIDQSLDDQSLDQKNESNERLSDELIAKLEDVDLNTNSEEDAIDDDVESSDSRKINEQINESMLSKNESLSKDNDEKQTNKLNSQLNSNPKQETEEDNQKQQLKEIDSNLDNRIDDDRIDDDQSREQTNNSFKITNLDHLLSATLTDNSLTDEIKLNVLCSKIVALSTDDRIDVQPFADSILKLLVKDDIFINSSECMQIFFSNYIKHLPQKLLAEILSVLIAVFKKSILNVELSKGILLDCLAMYVEEKEKNVKDENLIRHFLREMIGQLCNYSCNVKELKTLIKISENDPQLLSLIRQANLHQRGRPSSFFNFSGTKSSVLALPPLNKLPSQNGWTFICWFRIEPNPINSQPYLYYLRSSKSNIGYSAHFTGNCLVLTSMKVKSKGFQHCIPYEFNSYKWYHCAITYIAKWRTSEIKVYVNGQLTANNEMAWQVQTQDIFDKCFIGGTSEVMNEAHLFSGQLSSIYMFSEALNPSQIW